MTDVLRVYDVDQVEGFSAVAESVTWDSGEIPGDLCVIKAEGGLGALALRAVGGRHDVRAVLYFVDLFPDQELLDVPRNLKQVADLTGRVPTVQNPLVAKGVGILGGNTAGAIASHYVRGPEAAVRVIRVNGIGDIWVDPDATVIGGLIRHQWKRMRAAARDTDARDTKAMQGTNQLNWERAIQLGGRACALMPLSSVNRLWQAPYIPHEAARRGHVLASGDTATPHTIERIGKADIPQK